LVRVGQESCRPDPGQEGSTHDDDEERHTPSRWSARSPRPTGCSPKARTSPTSDESCRCRSSRPTTCGGTSSRADDARKLKELERANATLKREGLRVPPGAPGCQRHQRRQVSAGPRWASGEHQRSRNEVFGIGIGEVGRVGSPLRNRAVTRVLDEPPELGVGRGMDVDQEIADRDSWIGCSSGEKSSLPWMSDPPRTSTMPRLLMASSYGRRSDHLMKLDLASVGCSVLAIGGTATRWSRRSSRVLHDDNRRSGSEDQTLTRFPR
jgi:hypothetical protein